jgi:hypothetical protein
MRAHISLIAALFLATGTAHADNEKWEASFRQCHISKWFSKDELAAIGWARETEGQTIVIEAEEIPDILKAISVIKKCKAFYQCLEDRDFAVAEATYRAAVARWPAARQNETAPGGFPCGGSWVGLQTICAR